MGGLIPHPILSRQVMAIELIPVTSSQIAAVSYDPGNRELVVMFRAGSRKHQAIYCYAGVPPELGTGLIAAESPGAYFHRPIRNGGYPYRRLDGCALAPGDAPTVGSAS